ncbi:MAG: hypothetical protein DRG59_11285 [Deltaproteobacteria bacterium]|nr:MAG: hypothetical protein DRG59_11285 [Deltaproteobacteria bacterium]
MANVLNRLDLKIYSAIIGGAFPLFLVYYGWNRFFNNKYIESALYRLGLKYPLFEGIGERPIWIHALSVGETMAAVPLVRAIKARNPDLPMVFSTSTETGQETARKKLNKYITRFFYLPHDFPWALRRLILSLMPRIFITIETDAWPNLLHVLKEYNIPAFLVNGRISPGSFRRFSRFPRYSRFLFDSFDMCLMQSADDVDRFLKLGIGKNKVKNTGNLKFDMLPTISSAEKAMLAENLGIGISDKIWVSGSTHEGEEKIILDAFTRVISRIPELRLILVPRHPNRATHVKKLVVGKGLGCALRSVDRGFGNSEVLVVDTLGELAKLYSLADLAFIGGSLVPVGGHNPLEALAFGVPVILGPYMYNFREIEALLFKSNCAVKVSTVEDLTNVLMKLLGDSKLLRRMGDNARRVVEINRGTSKRVVELLVLYL